MSMYSRTPTRVLLYESSRVIGLPTRLVGPLDPATVTCSPSGPAMHLSINEETHVMARQHAERLRRMLAIAPMHLQPATEGQP
jgi:hypothetical protein